MKDDVFKDAIECCLTGLCMDCPLYDSAHGCNQVLLDEVNDRCFKKTVRSLDGFEEVNRMAHELCATCHRYKNCKEASPCTMAFLISEALIRKGYKR